MSSTNKTINYELSQFISTDKPTWLVDYNTDMNRIDLGIKGVSDIAGTNASNINLLTGRMTTAEGNIVNLQASSTQHGGDITDLKASDIVIRQELSATVKSVNGITPDAEGNVSIPKFKKKTYYITTTEANAQWRISISENGYTPVSATLRYDYGSSSNCAIQVLSNANIVGYSSKAGQNIWVDVLWIANDFVDVA